MLHARRAGRRRPLREDGAQRHRVRRHAADRRGVRPAPGRAGAPRRPRSRRSSGSWNAGDLESFLIEITAEVLAHVDAATGKPFVDVVLDQAEQKGTGRWTVQSALDLGVPITGIAEATFARSLSGHAEQREAARQAFADAGRHAGDRRRPGRVRRGRAHGAVRVQGRRLRPGLRPDRGRQRGVRLGHRPRWRWPPSGGAAASSGPGSWTGSGRRTTRSRTCRTLLVAPYFADGGPRRRGQLAAGGRRRGAGRHPDPGVLLVARLLRRPARGTGCPRR